MSALSHTFVAPTSMIIIRKTEHYTHAIIAAAGSIPNNVNVRMNTCSDAKRSGTYGGTAPGLAFNPPWPRPPQSEILSVQISWRVFVKIRKRGRFSSGNRPNLGLQRPGPSKISRSGNVVPRIR